MKWVHDYTHGKAKLRNETLPALWDDDDWGACGDVLGTAIWYLEID